VLVVVGAEALARKRDGLVFFGIVSFLLLLPVVNGRFESSVPKARYVAPLLPICFAAIAVALLHTWRWSGRVAARLAPSARLVVRGGLGLVAIGVVVMPLGGLAAYYQSAIQEKRTNAAPSTRTRWAGGSGASTWRSRRG
jgi:hypothetical protein